MKRSTALLGLLLPFGFYVAAMSPAGAADKSPGSGDAVRVAAAEDFIKLTLPDGSEARLQPKFVIRIRRTIASESSQGAKTRIDWVQPMLVREAPETVVAQVGAVLPSLGKLLMPDNSPIWFNATVAEGPMPLSRDKLDNGVLSGVYMGNKLQYLASTPEQVRNEIAAKGGNALPVPGPFAGPRTESAPIEVWDAEIRQ